jgi:hypothetical protein
MAVRDQIAHRDRGCRFTSLVQVEMNELIPRSQTRGRPPEQRFNSRICIMLHPRVHELFTRNILRIVPLDVDAGADGAVRFEVRDAASPLWLAFRAFCADRYVTLRWESVPDARYSRPAEP